MYIPAGERNVYDHSILSDDSDLHIPLRLDGVTSKFYVRKPTQEEVMDVHQDYVIHVHMTSDQEWNPEADSFYEHESAIRASLEEPPLATHQARGRAVYAANRAYDFDFEDPTSVIDFEDTDVGIKSLSRTQLAAHGALDIDSFAVPLTREIAAARVIKRRKGFVNYKELASRWKIGEEAAQRTVERTTQLAVRDYTSGIKGRRLKPYTLQLRYPRLNTTLYTDVLVGKCTSLLGNKYATVFCDENHWTFVDPLVTRSDAHLSLDRLFHRYGIPKTLVPDNAKELTQGEFKKKAGRASCQIHPIEAHTPNQNIAETGIRELLRGYRRKMRETDTPACLWDVCLQTHSEIRRHTALNLRGLRGDVPEAIMTGDTPDISHICEHGWYDYVWYSIPQDASKQTTKLGRYCGPSYDVGEALCGRVLTENAEFSSRTSIWPLTDAEKNSEVVQAQKARYEEKLKAALERKGRKYEPLSAEDDEDEDLYRTNDPTKPENYEPLLDTDPTEPELVEADDLVNTQYESYDKYVSAKVMVPRGDQLAFGTVVRRKRDFDRNLIGRSDPNPLMDTSVYEVEMEDGALEDYTANIIAESIYARVDDEGYDVHVIDELVDHRSDATAIKREDAFFTLNGKRTRKKTTRGWQLCIRWKDGTTSWMDLKDLKDADPVMLAEYAQSNQLLEEPAFAWWAPMVLKKKTRIVRAMKNRYFRRHQKYGLELPKTWERAQQIDRETGTTYWRDALEKEMKNVLIAFDIMEDGDEIPPGYQQIDCHVVWDIKSDFTRKARMVAGGHMTEPPAAITYASVVSRESVRIAFMLAALNDLDVSCADATNAYLNAPAAELCWTTLGPEFGRNAGKRAKIVRALYGLRSAGASWRSYCADILRHTLRFRQCRADNDVWMRMAVDSNGVEYWEYLLVYTDDFLCVSKKAEATLKELGKYVKLKGDPAPPTQYLGASIEQFKFAVGEPAWCMGSEQYVKEAIRNVKNWLKERDLALTGKGTCVLPSGYRPELDLSSYCNDDDANWYQQQIGVLRWAVELGRIDICCEVSMLASYCAAPRVGHLQAVLHLYSYLNHHARSRLVLDPTYLPHQPPTKVDWSEFYPDAKEELPPDMPKALGRPVVITTFEDSDHAGDSVTRRSRTGVLIMLNSAPILWYSKKQSSIETSSFGSEFSALKTAVELTEGILYKLRMMGVPVELPAYIKGDNMSVIKNSSVPESVLRKKSNSIAYHYVRERAAMGHISVSYEKSESNVSDMLTKIQSGTTRRDLAKEVLY